MKNVIACCDGTWDKPEQISPDDITGSNVYKISQLMVNDGASQVVYYHTGVGADGNIFQKLDGGITGDGLDDNIKDAYSFIVNNYELGDNIYLLGFSRGAYTARSLAGFIVNCGILKKQETPVADAALLDQAFEFYRDRTDATHPNSDAAHAFVAANSYPPAVYFIGVWETVGDLGIPLKIFQTLQGDKYNFHDVQLSSIVPYAYQALAVDEHREIFNATLWQHSDTAVNNNIKQAIEQVWFVGAHGNVGGDYTSQNGGSGFTPGLGDLTLLWMIDKAMPTGLIFKDDYSDGLAPNPLDTLVNSNSGGWFALDGFHDFFRPINTSDPVDPALIKQSVDDSVYDRITRGNGYNPPNVPPQA